MKNLFLALILSLFSIASNSQTVNDIPIKDIDVEYIMIVGTTQMFSSKVTVEIDFGQETKFFSSTKVKDVRNASGKQVKFNSMIDALNFMSANGYEFVNAYAITVSNQNVYHFILRNTRHKVE